MQKINDMINRWHNGNSGTVRSWTGPEKQTCRALVRDDGKILSKIDCWDGLEDFQLPSDKGRIVSKTDGPYLVEPKKRYEI